MSHADAVMSRSLNAVGPLFGVRHYIWLSDAKREAAENLLDAMDAVGNVVLAEETDTQDEGI